VNKHLYLSSVDSFFSYIILEVPPRKKGEEPLSYEDKYVDRKTDITLRCLPFTLHKEGTTATSNCDPKTPNCKQNQKVPTRILASRGTQIS